MRREKRKNRANLFGLHLVEFLPGTLGGFVYMVCILCIYNSCTLLDSVDVAVEVCRMGMYDIQ